MAIKSNIGKTSWQKHSAIKSASFCFVLCLSTKMVLNGSLLSAFVYKHSRNIFQYVDRLQRLMASDNLDRPICFQFSMGTLNPRMQRTLTTSWVYLQLMSENENRNRWQPIANLIINLKSLHDEVLYWNIQYLIRPVLPSSRCPGSPERERCPV